MSQATLAAESRTGARVMQAATLSAPQTFSLETAAVAEPGPGQVRIRVEGCGLCGSSIPLWEGRNWFDYPQQPGAPGHEAWGVVDEIGENVTRCKVGDRVAALSYHGFAQYDIADAEAVVVLPSALSGRPFPGEPLACAMNIMARSDIRSEHTIVIIGAGFIGALLTQLASATGARVIAVSRRRFALDVARACGAAETVQLEDRHAARDQVLEISGGALCDRVIEAAGLQVTLDLAGELTRERGRLVIAGFHQDGPRQVDLQLWNWRGIDVINAHERDPAMYLRGLEAAVDAVVSGHLNPDPLLTHLLPLRNIADAFRLQQERPDGFLKAVVMP